MSGPSHRAAPAQGISAVLASRIRPVSMAGHQTLPVLDAFATLLPTGLPRGATVTVSGAAARSFAFALTAAAGQAGSWLAVLGLHGPGWRAVAELGVATERIVHIDLHTDAGGAAGTGGTAGAGRAADVIAAALDGFDLVVVGPQVGLSGNIARRLASRARERGAVLIGVDETAADLDRTGTGRSGGTIGFDAVADLRVTTRTDGWQGLGPGTGRLVGRPVEIVAEGKRLPGRRRRTRSWLPGPDGAVTPVLTTSATLVSTTLTPTTLTSMPADRSSDPSRPARRVERSA